MKINDRFEALPIKGENHTEYYLSDNQEKVSYWPFEAITDTILKSITIMENINETSIR
jgi:hypothetical protein